MSAILTFLLGGGFRAIWGEISTWINAKQEHEQELARMKLQADLDSAKASQQLEAMKTQSALGIQLAQVTAQTALDQSDADTFNSAIKLANASSGVRWVDAWNGTIRPAFATVVLILWVGSLIVRHGVLNDWDTSLMGSVAGFFFADRALRTRGK
jgi:hypothetical protein